MVLTIPRLLGECLLAESDLTLTKAIAVAQAAEIADTGVRELQSSTTGASGGFPKEEKSLHEFTTTATVKPKDNPRKSAKTAIVVVLSTILISVASS